MVVVVVQAFDYIAWGRDQDVVVVPDIVDLAAFGQDTSVVAAVADYTHFAAGMVELRALEDIVAACHQQLEADLNTFPVEWASGADYSSWAAGLALGVVAPSSEVVQALAVDSPLEVVAPSLGAVPALGVVDCPLEASLEAFPSLHFPLVAVDSLAEDSLLVVVVVVP